MSTRIYTEMQQLHFSFRSWGGKRRGAGRKPAGDRRSSVPHLERPAHQHNHPLHLTLRVSVRCLRKQVVFARVVAAIRAVNRSRGDRFRVVEFSVQWDHLHLIVEAQDKASIANGVRSLCARIVRSVNRLLARRGPLFPDRYHQQVLTTPRAVRSVLVYVLGNFRKHGTAEAQCGFPLDPFSSASDFDGFAGAFGVTSRRDPTDSAQTWLLARGWKRHGLIPIHLSPAARTG